VVSVLLTQNNILITTLQITDFFKINDWSHLEFTQDLPGFSLLSATDVLYIGYAIILVVLIIFTFVFVAGLFQEMADFADPPKAIQRLEERIKVLNTLRVKRLMS
jgi:hypothetical protein